MNTYLTIMVTILIVTQIIRIVQNAVSLHRQHQEVLRHIEWFDKRNVSQEDFDIQRECFYLLWKKLKEEDDYVR